MSASTALAQTPTSSPPAQTPPPQTTGSPAPSPLTLRIGDADFLIGGFMDATAVYRSTNVGSGLGTSFGSIPFSTTPQGNLSETRISAQNSRVSLLVTSPMGKSAVKGYLEVDFLGNAPTNVFVTSNAATMRLRLYWAQWIKGKFEFLAGQSWTMLTPNRNGISPVPGDLFYSQDVDTNYQVGLTWARQTQFRFVGHATPTTTVGLSIENPQQFTGGAVVLPDSFVAAQVDNNANAATPNSMPDIIGKVAFDPKTGGTHQHIEFAAVVRRFNTYNAATATSFSATGRGASVNVNFEPRKNLHLIATSYFSQGGGRYIFGLGPDFVINPDGSPALLDAQSGIGGVELLAKKTLLYAYYGLAKFGQNVQVDPANGKTIGYGIPGASGANRRIQESTVGFNHPIFNDPRKGALRLMVQYSLLTRTPWSVPAGTPSQAKSHMIFLNLRYVLP